MAKQNQENKRLVVFTDNQVLPKLYSDTKIDFHSYHHFTGWNTSIKSELRIIPLLQKYDEMVKKCPQLYFLFVFDTAINPEIVNHQFVQIVRALRSNPNARLCLFNTNPAKQGEPSHILPGAKTRCNLREIVSDFMEASNFAPEKPPIPEPDPAPENNPVDNSQTPEPSPAPVVPLMFDSRPVPEIPLAPEPRPIPQNTPAPEEVPNPKPEEQVSPQNEEKDTQESKPQPKEEPRGEKISLQVALERILAGQNRQREALGQIDKTVNDILNLNRQTEIDAANKRIEELGRENYVLKEDCDALVKALRLFLDSLVSVFSNDEFDEIYRNSYRNNAKSLLRYLQQNNSGFEMIQPMKDDRFAPDLMDSSRQPVRPRVLTLEDRTQGYQVGTRLVDECVEWGYKYKSKVIKYAVVSTVEFIPESPEPSIEEVNEQ